MRLAMFEGYGSAADRRRRDDQRCKAHLRAFDKAIGENACGRALRPLVMAHAAGGASPASRGSLENARMVFRNMCRVTPRYRKS